MFFVHFVAFFYDGVCAALVIRSLINHNSKFILIPHFLIQSVNTLRYGSDIFQFHDSPALLSATLHLLSNHLYRSLTRVFIA